MLYFTKKAKLSASKRQYTRGRDKMDEIKKATEGNNPVVRSDKQQFLKVTICSGADRL